MQIIIILFLQLFIFYFIFFIADATQLRLQRGRFSEALKNEDCQLLY
jgi:hypothetical protein